MSSNRLRPGSHKRIQSGESTELGSSTFASKGPAATAAGQTQDEFFIQATKKDLAQLTSEFRERERKQRAVERGEAPLTLDESDPVKSIPVERSSSPWTRATTAATKERTRFASIAEDENGKEYMPQVALSKASLFKGQRFDENIMSLSSNLNELGEQIHGHGELSTRDQRREQSTVGTVEPRSLYDWEVGVVNMDAPLLQRNGDMLEKQKRLFGVSASRNR